MKALVVPDIDGDPGQEPGAIEFRKFYSKDRVAGVGFRCPCGCGREGYLPIRAEGHARTQTPEWEWNGSEDAATLRPSVLQIGGCCWHGWLTDGEWRVA